MTLKKMALSLLFLLLGGCTLSPIQELEVKEVVKLNGQNIYKESLYRVGGRIKSNGKWGAYQTNQPPPVGETVCVQWESFLEKDGYYETECPK